eukprot:1152566-Amphidinium_carterae.2
MKHTDVAIRACPTDWLPKLRPLNSWKSVMAMFTWKPRIYPHPSTIPRSHRILPNIGTKITEKQVIWGEGFLGTLGLGRGGGRSSVLELCRSLLGYCSYSDGLVIATLVSWALVSVLRMCLHSITSLSSKKASIYNITALRPLAGKSQVCAHPATYMS